MNGTTLSVAITHTAARCGAVGVGVRALRDKIGVAVESVRLRSDQCRRFMCSARDSVMVRARVKAERVPAGRAEERKAQDQRKKPFCNRTAPRYNRRCHRHP